MSRADRFALAKMRLIEAIAHGATAQDRRSHLRQMVQAAPARGPVVIVCAADGAGSEAHDSNGGSSKLCLATRRDILAALEAHADLIPAGVRARIAVLALGEIDGNAPGCAPGRGSVPEVAK